MLLTLLYCSGNIKLTLRFYLCRNSDTNEMIRNFTIVIIASIVVLVSCFSNESKYVALRVRGSDSEVNLVQSIAENFMDQDSLVSVGVTGGGSGAGIAALINNKTDIANSSRAITDEEITIAKERGVYPYEIIFAQDVLAIIINENNPIQSLTLEQLGKIYSGEISNWKELGGNDEKIMLYGRQSSSGTYIFFREFIVKTEYDQSMIGMSGTAQIVEAVRADKTGVGYVSAGYLDEKVRGGLKVVEIQKDENTTAYSPLDKSNVVSGNYAITRPLMQYTNGKPEGKLLEFLLYQFSPEGQKIIESNGFYPVDTQAIIKKLTTDE